MKSQQPDTCRLLHGATRSATRLVTLGALLLLTALAFNTLGESLRIALDPTTKR